MTAGKLVEHFFRHEYGRLVASLSRRVGLQHIHLVEDAVQSAMMSALEAWPVSGSPANPSAWLYRAASNGLLGELRRANRRSVILHYGVADGDPASRPDPESGTAADEDLNLLRMLFVCCDPAIPIESQLVFALKTLCGFSVVEIAHRLMISEANVYKRLARARSRLRTCSIDDDAIDTTGIGSRLAAVHKVLYVLFTEGYQSVHAEIAVRRELCDEAIRLTGLLARHPAGSVPETSALLALMHLHRARLAARTDPSGGLLLLEEQDRARWDPHEIEIGMTWLADSARGDAYSRYHAEAAVAAEHCLAGSFDQTRWDRIAECYALLERLSPSHLHTLNRAVAVAEWQGPDAGLAVLDGFEPPPWLTGSHQWAAVLADLHLRAGNLEMGGRYRAAALRSAPTPAVRSVLERRLVVDRATQPQRQPRHTSRVSEASRPRRSTT